MNRRARVALAALLTIPCGLLVRMGHFGQPRFISKYGGSVCWAIMVYWIVAFLAPKARTRSVALAAALVSVLVEFGKLYNSPGLDAFRLTLAGQLLLGRFFAWQDILAYFLALAAAAWLDRRLIP